MDRKVHGNQSNENFDAFQDKNRNKILAIFRVFQCPRAEPCFCVFGGPEQVTNSPLAHWYTNCVLLDDLLFTQSSPPARRVANSSQVIKLQP